MTNAPMTRRTKQLAPAAPIMHTGPHTLLETCRIKNKITQLDIREKKMKKLNCF